MKTILTLKITQIDNGFTVVAQAGRETDYLAAKTPEEALQTATDILKKRITVPAEKPEGT